MAGWVRNVWSDGWRLAAALVSGVLLASAYPPIEGSEAAWVAFVPLLLVARFSTPLQALRWGWLGGFVFWLGSLAWLLQLGRTGVVWPVAFLSWVALAAYCAIFTGAFLAVTAALFEAVYRDDGDGRKETSGRVAAVRQMLRNISLVCVIPLTWVGFEYLRSVLFTGFPWNALGVSQYRNLAVIQWAEWGGVYAVSALVMVLNASITMMLLRLSNVYLRRQRPRFQAELAFGFLVCALCWAHGVRVLRQAGWRTADDATVRVALVQPNIEQRKKWKPDDERLIYAALEEGTEMALAFKGEVDLIVWPETSLPAPLNTGEAQAFTRGLAREGVPLLVGAMEILPGDPASDDWRKSGARFLNSSFLIDTNGAIADTYSKRHLVPFGEYLPFDRKIKFMRDLAPLGFSCTPGTVSTVFTLAARHRAQSREPGQVNVPFSVLICFEDAIASLARHAVRNGARFLIVQTNDAWFDPSSCSLQHMSHCVFRCVENRVSAVRCANTGVSCVIGRNGAIENSDLLRGENWGRESEACRISLVDVGAPAMDLTFYARYGDLAFALPCGVFALLAFVLVAVRQRRNNSVR